MALVEIDIVETSDDTVIGAPYNPFTVTAYVPSGATVIGGGFKVENLDNAVFSRAAIGTNGPTAAFDGWEVTVTPDGLDGQDVRVTAYATYVKVN